jgi:hypothetical protein
MSVPNHFPVVQTLFNTGLFDVRTHAGHGAFVDAVISALHAKDERWGHLKKGPGQSAMHGHAEDAALYLSSAPGQSQAVDFVGGAGGPNPQPGWIVDEPRYSAGDWLDPTQHGVTAAPPPVRIPSYAELGDDAFFRERIGVPLQADTLMAGQQLNDGSAVWFSRTIHSLMTASIAAKGGPIDANAIVKKHRNEWRAILGLPALP